MKFTFAFSLTCITLIAGAGCSFFDPWDIPATERAWVVEEYVGGRQCDPDSTYEPPDTEHLLEGVGIEVYDVVVEPYAVCEACLVCPTYAAAHYAQIARNDTAAAGRYGYEPSDGP